MEKIKIYKTEQVIEPVSNKVLSAIMQKCTLVSSKQLATILSKKSDDTLRKGRSTGYGFNYYKDKRGKVYYNLPEILKEIKMTI